MQINFLRSVPLALALATTVACSTSLAQQVADPDFHPSVAHPAFKSGEARVVLDEGHHNFHTLEGRYRPFAELLRRDGCLVTANRVGFTRSALAPFNVLVIANAAGDDLVSGTEASVAQPAFTPDEIDAVHGWVRSGGALLLIADHAPFGQAAAALAERFGIDMAKGYALDKAQAYGVDGDPAQIEFTRERDTLGRHAIMHGREPSERISQVVAFTGQSLAGPPGSSALLLLSPVALDLPPVSTEKPEDPAVLLQRAKPAAGRSLGIALEVGSGRVVVLGEAAMLTAQIMPSRNGGAARKTGLSLAGIDNQQFVLNTVRWLAGALVSDRDPPRDPSPVTRDAATTGARASAPASSAATSARANAGARPDFSGHWKLVGQETKAWRGQSSTGNFEEPVRITQSETRLLIEVQTTAPNGTFDYPLGAPARKAPEPSTDETWTVSEWKGEALVTTGRRAFTTPQGTQSLRFREMRKLTADARRMIVELRIDMQPADLIRTSQFERIP